MKKTVIVYSLICLSLFHVAVSAQSTEFTYQGQMQSASALANGVFDFEFALFSSAFGGGQLGSTQTRSGVNVANGIFSVSLDFGNQFDGSTRFLEIRVRQSGGGAFTTLSPRQSIASSPYAVRSLDAQNAVNSQTAANATNAANAVNATTATNFTGPLAGDVTGTQGSTTVARLRGTNVAATAPTNGQVLKFNSGANQWQPAPDDTGTGGGGTITGVTAGTGLTGGGLAGNVSISIANSGVGTAQIADNNVTDVKINSVSGAKVTGTVASATNSTQLGGVAANQFVQTNDPRLSDSRSPTAGSSNYVQNTTIAQPATNFNISGTGTAATFNATTQYNLSGNRILSTLGISNLFVGTGTGTTGSFNVFVGPNSGSDNTTGSDNSYFGAFAGTGNTTGSSNAFFGRNAGFSNTTGSDNSFFGRNSGSANTIGTKNSFFGRDAGVANNIGFSNSFFGESAGSSNTGGQTNSFFGQNAGFANTIGGANSFFGKSAGQANTTGFSNAFFGVGAGQSTTTSSENSFFGTGSGLANTTGQRNSFFGRGTGDENSTGSENTFIGYSNGSNNRTGSNNTLLGSRAEVASDNLSYATAIGSEAVVSASNRIVLGRADGSDFVQMPGSVIIQSLGTAGTTQLCRNIGNFIAACSSSLKYKTNISRFRSGLELVKNLKPITFDWKDGGMHDVGLGAEDIAKIEPLLVTYNDKGQVEGVKYDRIGVVLINAVKEQQKMIESQQSEIRALKALVCAKNKKADICRK